MRFWLTALLFLGMSGCASHGNQPPGSAPSGASRQAAIVASDDAITEDLRRRLRQELAADSLNVRAHTRDGRVTLNGRVRDERSKMKAENIARSVQGVVDVYNFIDVDGAVTGGMRNY
jgi:osmotically-inducible protein OsmY